MKFRTATILIGTLLLCILIHAESQPESHLPAMGYAFTRGPSAPSGAAQAEQIESALDQRLSTLANVVCHEQIARYTLRGKTTSQKDTLDVNVEVLNGIEKYSQIRLKQKSFQDMQKLPGTWSVGEMATLLSATRDAIQLGQARVSQEELTDLGRSVVMEFAYPASARRWYLKANSRVHWLPFEGRVWTSPENGEIRRISWLANDLPTESGVAQVYWTVDFSPVDLSALVVTLPQKAVFQVTYKNGADNVDWNVTQFSEYRRFSADSAIHFEE
jgi:hypothetical protein